MKKIIFIFPLLIISCKNLSNKDSIYTSYKNTGESENSPISIEQKIQELKYFYLELKMNTKKSSAFLSHQNAANLSIDLLCALDKNQKPFLEFLDEIQSAESSNFSTLNLRLENAKNILKNVLEENQVLEENDINRQNVPINVSLHSSFSNSLIRIIEELFMGIERKEKISNECNSQSSAAKMLTLIGNLFLNFTQGNLNALENLNIVGENNTCIHFKNSQSLVLSFVKKSIEELSENSVKEFFGFCIKPFGKFFEGEERAQKIESIINSISKKKYHDDPAYGSYYHSFFTKEKLAFYLSLLNKLD